MLIDVLKKLKQFFKIRNSNHVPEYKCGKTKHF